MTDDDSKIELNRRRVLGGMVTVGAAAAAAGAGTFAAFSDTESSDENSITAGTLDLGSTSGGGFTFTGIVPGDRVPSGSGTESIETTYGGSVDADIGIDFALSEPDNEPEEPTVTPGGADVSAQDFADELNIETAQLTAGSDSVDLTGEGGGASTLGDLADNSYSGLLTVSGGTTITLNLAFTFDPDAGNDFQADGVEVTATFSAEQS